MAKARRSRAHWDSPSFFGNPLPPSSPAASEAPLRSIRPRLSSSEEITPPLFRLLPKAAPVLEFAPRRQAADVPTKADESGLSMSPERRQRPRNSHEAPFRTTERVRTAPPPSPRRRSVEPPHAPSPIASDGAAAPTDLRAFDNVVPLRRVTLPLPPLPALPLPREPVPVRASRETAAQENVANENVPHSPAESGFFRTSVTEFGRMFRERRAELASAAGTAPYLKALRRAHLLQIWTTALVTAFAFGTGYLLGNRGSSQDLPVLPAATTRSASPSHAAPQAATWSSVPRVDASELRVTGQSPEISSRHVKLEDLPVERRR